MKHPIVLDQEFKKVLGDRPHLLQFALKMTTLEDWITYSPRAQQAIRMLGNLFETAPNKAGIHITDADLDTWVRILAYIPTADAIALMKMLGQAQPGFGGDLLLCCARNDEPGGPLEAEARVSLARIAKLARFQILERVFGPDRRSAVKAVLEDYNSIRETNL